MRPELYFCSWRILFFVFNPVELNRGVIAQLPPFEGGFKGDVLFGKVEYRSRIAQSFQRTSPLPPFQGGSCAMTTSIGEINSVNGYPYCLCFFSDSYSTEHSIIRPHLKRKE